MQKIWDNYWQDESQRDYWSRPDPAVIELAAGLDKTRVSTLLDIGCGIGRHSLFLAQAGFQLTALDASSEALKVLQQRADDSSIRLKVVQGNYTDDIFEENSF